MVNRGEERVWVQMNVVPRSTGNTNSGTRELTLKCKLKCYFKPMNNPLGVSPSKGKQGNREPLLLILRLVYWLCLELCSPQFAFAYDSIELFIRY